MRVPSAAKHGIDPEDSINAARTAVYVAALDEGHPQRELRLGFDRHARLLELVVLLWDDGTEEIIHSMRARTQYLALLFQPPVAQSSVFAVAAEHLTGMFLRASPKVTVYC